jgi:hypothetical protein
MCANGPAICVGCVTRRKHRAGSLYPVPSTREGQKAVTVQDLNCEQMSVSGCKNHYKFVLGAGAIKNRDKLIDPTIRVMCCPDLFSYGNLGLFQVFFDRITFSRAIDSFIVNLILQGQQQLPEVCLSSSVQI